MLVNCELFIIWQYKQRFKVTFSRIEAEYVTSERMYKKLVPSTQKLYLVYWTLTLTFKNWQKMEEEKMMIEVVYAQRWKGQEYC